jgi:hypothetical protein
MCSIVSAIPSASLANDSHRLLLAKTQKAGTKWNDQIFSERSFSVAHGLRYKIHHPHVTLNALRQFGFGQSKPVPLHKIREYNLFDTRLAQ